MSAFKEWAQQRSSCPGNPTGCTASATHFSPRTRDQSAAAPSLRSAIVSQQRQWSRLTAEGMHLRSKRTPVALSCKTTEQREWHLVSSTAYIRVKVDTGGVGVQVLTACTRSNFISIPPVLNHHTTGHARQEPRADRQESAASGGDAWRLLGSLFLCGSLLGPPLDGIHTNVGLLQYDSLPLELGAPARCLTAMRMHAAAAITCCAGC